MPVVVFVQGMASEIRQGEEVGTGFQMARTALVARGYPASHLLLFSYAGGVVDGSGAWQPFDHDCTFSSQPPGQTEPHLVAMLRGYGASHPYARFWIVGHSLGGVMAFDAAGQLAGSSTHVDGVVTLDSPLAGIGRGKALLASFFKVGGCSPDAVLDALATRDISQNLAVRGAAARSLRATGVHIDTFGSTTDCFYNPSACGYGTFGFSDDRQTQTLSDADQSALFAIPLPRTTDGAVNVMATHAAILTYADLIGRLKTLLPAP